MIRTDHAGREVFPEQELDPEELRDHYDRTGYEWRRVRFVPASEYVVRMRAAEASS